MSVVVNGSIKVSFEKDGRFEEFNKSFISAFLEDRPLGMTFLFLSEQMDDLVDFVLRDVKRVHPEKETYTIMDVIKVVSQETEENNEVIEERPDGVEETLSD